MTKEKIQQLEEHARAIQKIIIEETENDKSSAANCLLCINAGDESFCVVQGRPVGVANTVAGFCKEDEDIALMIRLTQAILLVC